MTEIEPWVRYPEFGFRGRASQGRKPQLVVVFREDMTPGAYGIFYSLLNVDKAHGNPRWEDMVSTDLIRRVMGVLRAPVRDGIVRWNEEREIWERCPL